MHVIMSIQCHNIVFGSVEIYGFRRNLSIIIGHGSFNHGTNATSRGPSRSVQCLIVFRGVHLPWHDVDLVHGTGIGRS